MSLFASFFRRPPPVKGDPRPYDRSEFSGSDSDSDSDSDPMAVAPAPPPQRGKRDRGDGDGDDDGDGDGNRTARKFRPSSCVCTQFIASGSNKKANRINKQCGEIPGEFKICLNELGPFANDKYIALSIETKPSTDIMFRWPTYDDDTLLSKQNEYTQNSISEIQNEIDAQLVFVNWGLAPEIVGVIAIREDGSTWIGPPFRIPGYGDTVEVIIVMKRCNQNIAVTAKEVYDLFVKLASKDNPYLYCDGKLRNLCPSDSLKFIDFGIIVKPQFVKTANDTLGESRDKVALMSYSMLLIFTMATNMETQMNSRISRNQYKLMLQDLKQRGYVQVLLDNIDDLVAYLGLYESFVIEHSPIGMLLHYTVWPQKHRTVQRYIDSTRVIDNNIRRAIENRNIWFPEVKVLICNHIRGILTGILSNPEYGGSKRKTRRRIKKRGKKGKTRRR